ncbi:hypothetical protein N7463_008200 [Penicillium fimorum]|uniref:Uncharacterized protein n=1 Tax=Penicillium fimorum TaxID=1882269 RepID=A0A9W9XNJ7_9EURO|nr:hypothetical protein N7463_008200 [Penicillium fimorum]
MHGVCPFRRHVSPFTPSAGPQLRPNPPTKRSCELITYLYSIYDLFQDAQKDLSNRNSRDPGLDGVESVNSNSAAAEDSSLGSC